MIPLFDPPEDYDPERGVDYDDMILAYEAGYNRILAVLRRELGQAESELELRSRFPVMDIDGLSATDASLIVLIGERDKRVPDFLANFGVGYRPVIEIFNRPQDPWLRIHDESYHDLAQRIGDRFKALKMLEPPKEFSY